MTEEKPGRRKRQRPAQGGNGRFITTDEAARKAAEACRMRSRGKTYREIAQALGYANEGGAYVAVKRALEATVVEQAAEVRQFELDRLDAALVRLEGLAVAATEVLSRRHVKISAGAVVRDVVDGEVVVIEDDGPVLAAVDRLNSIESQRLQIAKRRADLLGLDAPAKADVSGKLVLYAVEGVDMEALK